MTEAARPAPVSVPAQTAVARSGRRGPRLGRVGLHVTIGILLFVWLLPTLGMLVNSFRPAADVSRSGWWTALGSPGSFTTENYAHVLAQAGLGQAFINSLFITIPATIIPVAVASFAAYAFAWMNFRGRDALSSSSSACWSSRSRPPWCRSCDCSGISASPATS
jgi:alpha-glucoside transport system permease protein